MLDYVEEMRKKEFFTYLLMFSRDITVNAFVKCGLFVEAK